MRAIRRAIAAALLGLSSQAQAEPPKRPGADHAAEPALKRERIGNLGLFAGYVVACGLASEAEADAMVAKLSQGLGAPFSGEDSELLQKARTAARKVSCDNPELRDAVTKGWTNFREAK